NRADLGRLQVAKQLVDLREGRIVERAVLLVDVALELFTEVLGADPDLARRLVERGRPDLCLRGVVAGEDGSSLLLRGRLRRGLRGCLLRFGVRDQRGRTRQDES